MRLRSVINRKESFLGTGDIGETHLGFSLQDTMQPDFKRCSNSLEIKSFSLAEKCLFSISKSIGRLEKGMRIPSFIQSKTW